MSRIPQYLALSHDGTYFYVNSDGDDYETFRVYIMSASDASIDVRQLEVEHVERYRDGGTTIIETAEGELYMSSPLGPPRPSTWTPSFNSPIELEQLNIADHVIATDKAGRPTGLTPLPDRKDIARLTDGLTNSDGAPVHYSSLLGWRHLVYCGRHLGTDVIDGSDGQCGPDNGPQCPSCRKY